MIRLQTKVHARPKIPGRDMTTERVEVRRSADGGWQIPDGTTQPAPATEALATTEGWNQIVDCEARNALQVILSGSEILLDEGCRLSSLHQRTILERILSSAHRLNSIIATLTRPDNLVGEIVVESAVVREL